MYFLNNIIQQFIVSDTEKNVPNRKLNLTVTKLSKGITGQASVRLGFFHFGLQHVLLLLFFLGGLTLKKFQTVKNSPNASSQ